MTISFLDQNAYVVKKIINPKTCRKHTAKKGYFNSKIHVLIFSWDLRDKYFKSLIRILSI